MMSASPARVVADGGRVTVTVEVSDIGPGDETVTLATAGDMPGGASVTRDTLILADPFGVVFDSETGAAVSGAQITLRDATTGALAQVFAEDGVLSPATVLKAGPCVVVQRKTADRDGYDSVQLGLVEEGIRLPLTVLADEYHATVSEAMAAAGVEGVTQ